MAVVIMPSDNGFGYWMTVERAWYTKTCLRVNRQDSQERLRALQDPQDGLRAIASHLRDHYHARAPPRDGELLLIDDKPESERNVSHPLYPLRSQGMHHILIVSSHDDELAFLRNATPDCGLLESDPFTPEHLDVVQYRLMNEIVVNRVDAHDEYAVTVANILKQMALLPRRYDLLKRALTHIGINLVY